MQFSVNRDRFIKRLRMGLSDEMPSTPHYYRCIALIQLLELSEDRDVHLDLDVAIDQVLIDDLAGGRR